ncbi:hypothetical protein [Streptomyces sp. NPDC090112]|uniref:hypothetical protein n=1 Tax=Streptomyces sp. NPDC090112 TaxID=3365949 RepID=UPI00381DD60A
MHDLPEHDWVTLDFGVTALGASFHSDWILQADDRRDHLNHLYQPEGDPTPVLLLIEDLLRLRDSGLSGTEIDLLWQSTDVALGVPGIAGEEREWSDEVLAWAVPLAQGRGARTDSVTTYPACVPDGPSSAAAAHRRLTNQVLDLVELLSQDGAGDTPLDATRAALRRCASTVCSELAFRFLISALMRFAVRLSPLHYGRMERLGASFGYGPHVVDAAAYHRPPARPRAPRIRRSFVVPEQKHPSSCLRRTG